MNLDCLKTVPIAPLTPAEMRLWLKQFRPGGHAIAPYYYLAPVVGPYASGVHHLNYWTRVMSLACTGRAAELPPGDPLLRPLADKLEASEGFLQFSRRAFWGQLCNRVSAEILGQAPPAEVPALGMESDFDIHGWWAALRAEVYVFPDRVAHYPEYEENAEHLNSKPLPMGPMSNQTPWAILLGWLEGLPAPYPTGTLSDVGYYGAYREGLVEWHRKRL